MERTITAKCIDYTHDGKGVVKVNKIPTFVENVLIGEDAKILITKREKGYNLGKRIELISVSENRCKPRCENYRFCGGCHVQHMVYEEQLRFKQARVREAIKRIGGVEIETPVIHGMEDPLRYRNKVQVPIGQTYDGKIIAGFYKKGSHQIIDMEECFIEDKAADEIINTIKKIIQRLKIEPCDIYYGKGVIRYVIVRKSFDSGDIMVVVVTKNEKFPQSERFVNELVEKHPQVKTVIQNINPARTSVVLGQREKTLFGKGYILDKINGLSFKISAHSFYQVNPVQTEILYKKAVEFAALTGKESILDAYCGVGTIGLIAAKNAKKVTGVELVKSAVDDAVNNARANKIENAIFYNDDATAFINKMAHKGLSYHVMFLDPPRDGCSKEFIGAVMEMEPKRIVYVSCDPSSLARDIKILKEKYELSKIECVDMFPQTYHIETVALLSLKK